jgi:hypothetical protein
MFRYTFLILLLLTTGQALAQGEANSLKGTPFKERIMTGGGMGLGFGGDRDFISVSPVIGYALTRKIIAGTSITYRYTNFKLTNPSIKLNDYGVSPFVRWTVYKSIFIQTEYEYLNYEYPLSTRQTVRYDFKSFLAGGGFIQPISDKVAFYLMALYNFSYQDPVAGQPRAYTSPLIIRGGISIGNFGF